jgi:hypothetical protein
VGIRACRAPGPACKYWPIIAAIAAKATIAAVASRTAATSTTTTGDESVYTSLPSGENTSNVATSGTAAVIAAFTPGR